MAKIFLFVAMCILLASAAQADELPDNETVLFEPQHVIKLNLPSLLATSLSVQFERVLQPGISAAIGLNYRPERGLPFGNLVQNLFLEEDDQANQLIEETLISFRAITPEVRFYLADKGAPHGFYLGPFLRLGKWEASTIFEYEPDDESDDPFDVNLSGNFNYLGGGLMLGFQRIRENITFDFWVVGPFFALVDGGFLAKSTADDLMTESERRELQQDINDTDFRTLNVKANIKDDEIDISVDGFMPGIRGAGFTIGYRF